MPHSTTPGRRARLLSPLRALGLLAVLWAAAPEGAGLGRAEAASPPPQPAPGRVTVVHGVPGLVVDVYVDGNLALPGFEPETITDPISLPPGIYDVRIVPAGRPIAEAAIVGELPVAAGSRQSAVAHLAADGSPTLSVFDDAKSESRAACPWRWFGNLTVRHAAAAPEVDVLLFLPVGRWLLRLGVLDDLSNGEQARVCVPGLHYRARITPAQDRTTTVVEAGLAIEPQTSTVVYAIGSLADGTFKLLVNVRPLR